MKVKSNKFFKHLLSRFYLVDELNESNLLVKFIGVIFLILGLGYIFDWVYLSPLAILSFSLAGIFFVLSDLSAYMAEEWNLKKALGNERFKKVRFFKGTKYTLLFIGVLLMIAGPYLNIVLDKQFLDMLGTASAFIAIGLTVIKISLDNKRKNYDMYDSIVTESFETYEKIQRLEKELKELKKE